MANDDGDFVTLRVRRGEPYVLFSFESPTSTRFTQAEKAGISAEQLTILATFFRVEADHMLLLSMLAAAQGGRIHVPGR